MADVEPSLSPRARVAVISESLAEVSKATIRA
jgi:hypothetical protein